MIPLTICSGSPQSETQNRYNGLLSTKEILYRPLTIHLLSVLSILCGSEMRHDNVDDAFDHG